MRASCARRRAVVLAAVAVPVVLAGGCAGNSPAASRGADQATPARCTAARGTWTAAEPASPGSMNNDLTGVTVLAAGNAWAVGSYADTSGGKTLVEHWNGTTWSVVSSPDPGGSGSFLSGVSAASPSAVWAVGQYDEGPVSGSSSLILHWNGTRWTQLPSPDPGTSNKLAAVTATSAASAWAVGSSGRQQPGLPFILHWNGTAWTQAAAPHLEGTSGELLGVDATSVVNVWAAGDVTDRAGQHSLILRWNGTRWTRAPSPDLGGRGLTVSLRGVAATSPASAWAAGYTANGAGSSTSVILHWNGTAWTRAASPSPGAGGGLESIATSSPASAWAVGQFGAVGGDDAFAVRYCNPPCG